jgi:HSP20 family protein
MTLAKLNPLFTEFGLAKDRLNRLFGKDDLWDAEGVLTAADWTPAVDILEGENEIVVKAELPGVDAKDIAVNVDNNVLTVKGERRFEKEVKKENYTRMERMYGTFSRSFALPTFIDPATVRAQYKDGLLNITLPKKEAAKTRNVEVKAA